MNITEFNAALSAHKGLDMSARYRVRITPPQFLQGHEIARNLEFFTESAMLPGVGLQTEEVQHSGFGVRQKMPNGIMFEDTSIVFLNTGDGALIDFFHQWIKFINGFERTNSSDVRDFFSYPSEYATVVEIDKMSIDGSVIFTWKLNEAYPMSIASITSAWSDENSPTRMAVTFTYRSWLSNRNS